MKHIKTPFNKTCLQSLFKKLQWKTVHIEPGDYYRVPLLFLSTMLQFLSKHGKYFFNTSAKLNAIFFFIFTKIMVNRFLLFSFKIKQISHFLSKKGPQKSIVHAQIAIISNMSKKN